MSDQLTPEVIAEGLRGMYAQTRRMWWQYAAEGIQAQAAELERLSLEGGRLRNLCLQLETARDERDAMLADLEQIGKTIGCGHVEDGLARCVRDVVQRAEQAEALATRLAAALKPFAHMGAAWDQANGTGPATSWAEVRVDDCRAAEATLAEARAAGVIP